MRSLWSRSALLVLVGSLIAFAVGCSRQPTIRPLSGDAVIVAFGDSLTFGYGADEGQDYPSRLAKLSGRQVVNAGVPGEFSGTGLSRLPSVLEANHPALVILCHGGNDILTGAPPETIAANLEAMIGLCRAAGADVLVLSVPQKGLSLRSAPFYAAVAMRCGVPCDDAVIARVLSKGSLKSDYVHPNAAGYAQIADAVWAYLGRAQR